MRKEETREEGLALTLECDVPGCKSAMSDCSIEELNFQERHIYGFAISITSQIPLPQDVKIMLLQCVSELFMLRLGWKIVPILASSNTKPIDFVHICDKCAVIHPDLENTFIAIAKQLKGRDNNSAKVVFEALKTGVMGNLPT